jgi:hypothetical protein
MAAVRLLLICAILARVQSVRFPERRDAVDDEAPAAVADVKSEVDADQGARDARHLGPGGFHGGLLDAAVTVADADPYKHRGRGRRPFPQDHFQQQHQPSRDYELLVNLLVRNASSWDNVNGDPRRFQDRLAAMLGESKFLVDSAAGAQVCSRSSADFETSERVLGYATGGVRQTRRLHKIVCFENLSKKILLLSLTPVIKLMSITLSILKQISPQNLAQTNFTSLKARNSCAFQCAFEA